jgi:methionyl-tRNA synthetase
VTRRVLITSALPYINGIKHLGNLAGSLLPADVYARFLRKREGTEVLFICATDEHGTPAELAALAEGIPVADYCRIQHERQAEIYGRFSLSFDYFGRTSSRSNTLLTQQFFEDLDNNGFIEERTIKQVYSVDDNRFLPDRYIIGTCPHCSYNRARGDQCENCTRVLDPIDLINPRSSISGSTNLEVRESRHLFLRLTLLAGEIENWIDDRSRVWPPLVTSIARKWLKEGLHDRGITRDLSWGVPVNRPGFEGKVFYVWFDAPIGYISSTRDLTPTHYEDWWKSEDVYYVQFMAKDNIPFHTISFPATILGARSGWKLVDYLKGFNWLNYYGGKFSTSGRRGIFMDQALDDYPADYWRYWLTANSPESDDASFTFEHFAVVINKDLADTLGNFINRTLRLTEAHFGLSIPVGSEFSEPEEELSQNLGSQIATYTKHLEALEFRKAAGELKAIWSLGNSYLVKAAPWTEVKSDRLRAGRILRTAINLVRIFALLAEPIIPAIARTIIDDLNCDIEEWSWPIGSKGDLEFLQLNHPFKLSPPLFKKISESEVLSLIARYSGNDVGLTLSSG